MVFLLAFGSVMCDYSNWHSVKDLQIPLNTYKSFDKFIETKTFRSLPDNVTIYAPDLFNPVSRLSWVYLHIWNDYVMAKIGKKVIITNDKKEVNDASKNKLPVYYLNFGIDRKNLDRHISIAKLKDNSVVDSLEHRLFSDSLTLFYYSTNKEFDIAFNTRISDTINYAKVNDSLKVSKSSYFKLRCEYNNYNDYFTPIFIISKNIDLESITISNQLTSSEVNLKL
ncbi:MAG: hypothetical protein HC831_26475 [Chloroflexia bacterium]|nr:hypothetical protein [Chloroflexia bacterium]